MGTHEISGAMIHYTAEIAKGVQKLTIFNRMFEAFFKTYGVSKAAVARMLGIEKKVFYAWMTRLEEGHKGYIAIEALLELLERDPSFSSDRVFETIRTTNKNGPLECVQIETVRSARLDILSELSSDNPVTRRRELLEIGVGVLENLEAVFCVSCDKCEAQKKDGNTKPEENCICNRFMMFLSDELDRLDRENVS